VGRPSSKEAKKNRGEGRGERITTGVLLGKGVGIVAFA